MICLLLRLEVSTLKYDRVRLTAGRFSGLGVLIAGMLNRATMSLV